MTTMAAKKTQQRNPYKGSPQRPWVRLRLQAADGSTQEVDLLADTGNPCGIIISRAGMLSLKRADAPDVQSNFGLLEGGWLHVSMPELGLDQPIVSYASDAVVAASKASSHDFDGLAGLPFLRLLEYGGDPEWFWLRKVKAHP